MAVIKKITAKWRDWNSANNLPKEPMSVRCKMINGKEDVDVRMEDIEKILKS